jgi:thioredoxin-like negative regulator of GroEL
MSNQPQSIVHQVIRLERKLVTAVSNLNRNRRHSQMSRRQGSSNSTFLAKKTAANSESFSFALPLEAVEDYHTINQNEFMVDHLVNFKNEPVFVHFFVEDSAVSKAIDQQMKQLTSSQPRCRFLRINTKHAPFVTAKLHVSSDRPTVAAMKNGSVVNRMSGFSSVECEELKQWVSTVLVISM